MKWWYENEEEEMKLYKDEDLCIECKNEFFSKPYDHRDPTPGQLGYCIKCDNFLIKDKKMEFDKTRVYTALNADELKAGDKVIVAYNLYGLKEQVKMFTESAIDVIEVIQDEDYFNRFKVKHGESFPLAYLVERARNCENCTMACGGREGENAVCEDWEGDEPTYKRGNYRPFKDTDELIKVWNKKFYLDFKPSHDPLTMPHIWVRHKATKRTDLIVALTYTSYATVYAEGNLENLFNIYEFLNGSPCGVEE